MAIAIACLWIMLLCIASAVYVGPHGIILLMFGGSFIFGAIYPRVQDAINKRVGSERRATILSTANLSRQFVFIPLSLVVGWSIEAYDISTGLYMIALWLLLAGVAWFAFWRVRA